MLATSRVPLGIVGEREFRLRPLEIPASADDVDVAPASRLLRRAARSAELGEPVARSAIVGICRTLDGFRWPWSLPRGRRSSRRRRSAAGWPTTGCGSTIRRATDRAALTPSWSPTVGLLDDSTRATFALLGVFTGPFDDAAAAAVVARPEVLRDLQRLVTASLLTVAVDAEGEPSFRMLEVVRAVAARQLARDPAAIAVHRRHAEWFADRGVAAADRFRSRVFGDLVAITTLRDPNLAAALDFATDAGDHVFAVGIATAHAGVAIHSGGLSFEIARLEATLASGPPARAHDRTR